VSALCTWRDQHGDRFVGSDPAIAATASGFVFESAYRVDGPGFESGGEWYRGEYHREEAARGLGATEDLWSAGIFQAELTAGEVLGITATTVSDGPPNVATEIIASARARAEELAVSAKADDDIGRILAIAADRFVVGTPSGPGAVAGYPWFGEWSRDLFTSFEGLFLCTGRAEEGRAVLLRAANTVSEGMLANTADVGTLEYNTIDGTLWFLHAVGRHVERTGDLDLVAELMPTIEAILSEHRTGTRFGIGVDADTGLLRGGADGYALTWMDARISGRPITARAGFPVEVQALWINGLGAAVNLLASIGEATAEWDALRRAAVESFRRLFPTTGRGVPDLVDESGAYSQELRPNQLLAASLPYGPVQDPLEVARIVASCRAELLTSIGLRSLSPNHPAYRGQHRGAPADRDAAYHQGTVWPWLIGPYTDAVTSVGMNTEGLLYGLEMHLAESGLGSVSETADGDAPHRTTGCPFQGWSVAELLRSRQTLQAVSRRRGNAG
jgi:predicted glycogen debranching enzyme